MINFCDKKTLILFLEWQVGSSPNDDDIFPRVKIGLRDSRKAEIESGELLIDGTSLNASIGEYAQRNWTKADVKEAKANTLFNMEPGLCLYVTMFAVGRSHLSSAKEISPLCVKRMRKYLNSNLCNRRNCACITFAIYNDSHTYIFQVILTNFIYQTNGAEPRAVFMLQEISKSFLAVYIYSLNCQKRSSS